MWFHNKLLIWPQSIQCKTSRIEVKFKPLGQSRSRGRWQHFFLSPTQERHSCIISYHIISVSVLIFVSNFKMLLYLYSCNISTTYYIGRLYWIIVCSTCFIVSICIILQGVCVFVFVSYFKMVVYLYLYEILKCLCICICFIFQNGQINLITLFSELKAVLIVNPHFLTKARAKSNSS